ncbi:hypothetical protein KXD40_004321 [Peronospora effusa]|uniref:Uncharacterized protein n=1 Tax=Peronospora effusa TaxID=542832 RepID=A0A3M6VID4_9STRA|nr:hypothetical protein DD238_004683 [Peronospora effusa]RQM08933.1 hypothetical protein DD237_008247 [Peronospora effusa]RQM13344.1 hypothetical protein DD237_003836 [Peronospora effusa]UIZ27863.1 hypothetical protein KXD40_004321 [Peronospora effusa]
MLIAGKVDVTETLTSPLLKIWINLCSRSKEKSLLTPLLNKLSKFYSELALANQLLVAQQGNGAAKETAKMLAKYQMSGWRHRGYSGNDVFELLGPIRDSRDSQGAVE